VFKVLFTREIKHKPKIRWRPGCRLCDSRCLSCTLESLFFRALLLPLGLCV